MRCETLSRTGAVFYVRADAVVDCKGCARRVPRRFAAVKVEVANDVAAVCILARRFCVRC